MGALFLGLVWRCWVVGAERVGTVEGADGNEG